MKNKIVQIQIKIGMSYIFLKTKVRFGLVNISNTPQVSSSRNILKQEPGPSRFAKKSCDSASTAFTLFMRQNLLDIICKWTNAEGRTVYKDAWKDVDSVEIKKFFAVIILIGVFTGSVNYI